jgi:hypothetical protein
VPDNPLTLADRHRHLQRRAPISRRASTPSWAPRPIPTEVVVVDNQSRTARPRWCASAGRRYGSSTPAATSASRAPTTSASARPRATYVLLLNPDTIVPPGAHRDACARAGHARRRRWPGRGIVDERGFPELSFGPMISPGASSGRSWWPGALRRGCAGWCGYVDRLSRQAGPRAWVSGACLLARRADARGGGLLDERFFLYTEDVDLCASVRARGRAVLFAPQAEIVHLRGRSAGRNPTGVSRRFYEKHLFWATGRHRRDATPARGASPDSAAPRECASRSTAQAARLRHRHLHPEPAHRARAARPDHEYVLLLGRPTWTSLQSRTSAAWPTASALLHRRADPDSRWRAGARARRPVPRAALRAAAADACRSVVTIHDCIHLMFPQYLPNRLALRTTRARRCGRHAHRPTAS